jgi:hypothetical protein
LQEANREQAAGDFSVDLVAEADDGRTVGRGPAITLDRRGAAGMRPPRRAIASHEIAAGPPLERLPLKSVDLYATPRRSQMVGESEQLQDTSTLSKLDQAKEFVHRRRKRSRTRRFGGGRMIF